MGVWPVKTIIDVCTFRGGGTPSKKSPEFWNGDIPWVSPKDMKFETIVDSIDRITQEAIEKSSASLIPVGAILVVVRSGILSRTVPLAKTAKEVTVNQDIKALIPSDDILSDYLYYFLRSAEPTLLEKVTRGATVHRLSTDDLKYLPIPFPPLEEQKRIVAILGEAFAAIDKAIANTEKNIANARELFDSCLSNEFQNQGEAPRLTLQELLDRGWITSHLDGNHGSDYPKKSEFVDSGVCYIAAKCIRGDQVSFKYAKYLTPERASLLRKGIAQNRDVLFAHNATVGPVAVLSTDEEKIILGTSLTYYRCNESHILPNYLAHYMRSKEFTSQYESVMRQSTRNQVPITMQRTFTHVIPTIDEQERIANIADEISIGTSRFNEILAQKTLLLTELKQSILQKAFSGELTSDTKATDKTLAKAGV